MRTGLSQGRLLEAEKWTRKRQARGLGWPWAVFQVEWLAVLSTCLSWLGNPRTPHPGPHQRAGDCWRVWAGKQFSQWSDAPWSQACDSILGIFREKRGRGWSSGEREAHPWRKSQAECQSSSQASWDESSVLVQVRTEVQSSLYWGGTLMLGVYGGSDCSLVNPRDSLVSWFPEGR